MAIKTIKTANDWLFGLVKTNPNTGTVPKVSGIPMPVLQDYLRQTNLTGYTTIPFDKIAVPRRYRTDKDGQLVFRNNGDPSVSTVKEVAQAGRTIITNLVAGMAAAAAEYKTTNTQKWSAHLSAEDKAAAPVLVAEDRILEAGMKRRLDEQIALEAEEAAIKAAADASAPVEEKVLVPA